MPRALVVGYGKMGGFHAKVLRDLGYEVATVDPDPSRRADFASVAEARPDRLRFKDLFHVAAVVTPPQFLLETAYDLAGIPKMLVEKPFATSTRDAELLSAYLHCRKTDVCVGLIERFNPVARALRTVLHDGTLRGITGVHFTRWNDRPSFDVDLDLRLHDVDLAAFLRISVPVTYDTGARGQHRVRTIEITHEDGVYTADLMDHDLSPLHGMWHAFLTDGDYPRPANVIHAHRMLDAMREAPTEVRVAA